MESLYILTWSSVELLYILTWFSVFLPAVAVLGIALIAMGEDIGADMTYRSFGHLVSWM